MEAPYPLGLRFISKLKFKIHHFPPPSPLGLLFLAWGLPFGARDFELLWILNSQ